MSTSLKAAIPEIAAVIGLTPDALYERQRALVREGALTQRPGRGPGSGVLATPAAIATLVLAAVVTAPCNVVWESYARLPRKPAPTFL